MRRSLRARTRTPNLSTNTPINPHRTTLGCALLTVGKGDGADVWHALTPLCVRSSSASAQRGEWKRC
eukprot:3131563-Prymnesium_polylepis.1